MPCLSIPKSGVAYHWDSHGCAACARDRELGVARVVAVGEPVRAERRRRTRRAGVTTRRAAALAAAAWLAFAAADALALALAAADALASAAALALADALALAAADATAGLRCRGIGRVPGGRAAGRQVDARAPGSGQDRDSGQGNEASALPAPAGPPARRRLARRTDGPAGSCGGQPGRCQLRGMILVAESAPGLRRPQAIAGSHRDPRAPPSGRTLVCGGRRPAAVGRSAARGATGANSAVRGTSGTSRHGRTR